MFVARNKNGQINVFKDKPIRLEEEWHWDYDINKSSSWRPINDTAFPELKWEDEPIEIDDLYFGLQLW